MKFHRTLFLPLFVFLIFVSGCASQVTPTQSPTSISVETEIPTLEPTNLPTPDPQGGSFSAGGASDTATSAPSPSATAEPSSTPEPTETALPTDTAEPAATEITLCQDDLAQVQETLSGQWSLLDASFSPQRAYYRSGMSDFAFSMVSSVNFATRELQLPEDGTAVVDTLTAYSVDDRNQLYPVDVTIGIQYPGQPYVLLLNRWSPLESAITNLDGAKEILSRGRLFDISLAEFVDTGEIVRWDQCPDVDWYVEYFGADTCRLGQLISEDQPGWITTLVQGDSLEEGEVPLFLGWVIHIPTNETALEWGVLEMPACP